MLKQIRDLRADIINQFNSLTLINKSLLIFNRKDSVKDYEVEFDKKNKEKTKTITITVKDSDDLRNYVSYKFLKEIVKAENFSAAILEQEKPSPLQQKLNKSLKKLNTNLKRYNPASIYGDLYTELMTNLENYLEEKPDDNRYDAIVKKIYQNDSGILEFAYAVIKKESRDDDNQTRVQFREKISERFRDKKPPRNQVTPYQREGQMNRLLDTVWRSDFKPQNTTSVPCIRSDRFGMIEIRIGTQAQRHKGEARVSPSFKRYLTILERERKAKKIQNDSGIDHVYFNGLALERMDRFEGPKEIAMTKKLHELEDSHSNIAVITLPSDQGIMSHDYLKKLTPSTLKEAVFQNFLAIASGHRRIDIQDFYISDAVKIKLYGNKEGTYDKENEHKILTNLLNDSFKKLGFENRSFLSDSEIQAVWCYFNKYQLTNYILTTLKPVSFNMSCKDGIDRATIHSLCHNLFKSFESNTKPMTRDDFLRDLQAASAIVKGRSINKHIDILWNVINCYVNANETKLENNPEKKWLVTWRNQNIPEGRQAQNEISKDKTNLASIKVKDLLTSIEKALEESGSNFFKDLYHHAQKTNNSFGQLLILHAFISSNHISLTIRQRSVNTKQILEFLRNKIHQTAHEEKIGIRNGGRYKLSGTQLKRINQKYLREIIIASKHQKSFIEKEHASLIPTKENLNADAIIRDVQEGIQKYKKDNTNGLSWLIKMRGRKRAEFFLQKIESFKEKDQFGKLICVFSLLSNNDGSTLQSCVLEKLGFSNKEKSSALELIEEQIQKSAKELGFPGYVNNGVWRMGDMSWNYIKQNFINRWVEIANNYSESDISTDEEETMDFREFIKNKIEKLQEGMAVKYQKLLTQDYEKYDSFVKLLIYKSLFSNDDESLTDLKKGVYEALGYSKKTEKNNADIQTELEKKYNWEAISLLGFKGTLKEGTWILSSEDNEKINHLLTIINDCCCDKKNLNETMVEIPKFLDEATLISETSEVPENLPKPPSLNYSFG